MLVGLEIRLQLTRALREQRHRLRRGQRRNGILLLARDVKPLPARREHARLQRRDDGRRLGQQLLEIVEHEQQLLLAHEGVQIVGGAEHLGDGRLHERRIGDRRERDEPDPVRELVRELGRSLQREPRLPGSTRAGERDERAGAQELRDRHELMLTTHQGVRLHRQVRLVQRLETRILPFAPLVDPLGRAQILEPMLPEIAKSAGVDECCGRRRDEHLSAVARCCDSCRAVDVRADVALRRQQRRAGVETHPHGQCSSTWASRAAASAPGAVGKARKRHRPACRPRRPDWPRTPHAGHGPMRGQRSRVLLGTQVMQQSGPTLDVSERKATVPEGRLPICEEDRASSFQTPAGLERILRVVPNRETLGMVTRPRSAPWGGRRGVKLSG